MKKNKTFTICGVMSGSSLDGLDMAICTFSKDKQSRINWNIDKAVVAPFSDHLVSDFLECYQSSSKHIYKVEQQFSQFCASRLSEFMKGEHVDYIGFHGHTIFHEPSQGYTTQIGNCHWIAQQLQIPVIGHFRNKDVALGGQGAPLAPIVEKYLFPEYQAFLNLGGIANISIHNSNGIIAYDITACNQALNYLAQQKGKKYDDGGVLASQGTVQNDLLESLNRLDFLKLAPPKSLSNSWVMNEFIPILQNFDGTVQDKMKTVVSHISRHITQACIDFKMKNGIMASGGGVYNTFMMNKLSSDLKKQNIDLIRPSDDVVEYKEALLMALMAYLRINEVPNCLASVTGASRDSCSGILYNPHL